MSENLYKSVTEILQSYAGSSITVAYSGGVDSQVLLHILAELKRQHAIDNTITVCHVHHGLSDNADKWASFAQQQAAQYQFPCHIIHVNLDKHSSQSIEEQARDARYQALLSVTNSEQLILTGHHSDDQTETVLLALKRGAGIKGLSAMAMASKRENRVLLRPLLKCSRQDIESYGKHYKLTWVEDESNENTRFDRNFIRQEIMPLLRQRWPSINTTINRSAEHCLDSQQLLDELAEMDLALAKKDPHQLIIKVLTSLSVTRFNNVLRYFLAGNQCELPSRAQLAQLHQQLFAKEDKTPEVKCGDHWLRRFQSELYLTKTFQDVSPWQYQLSFSQDESKTLMLPDEIGQVSLSYKTKSEDILLAKGQVITAPEASQSVSIRFTHTNPQCHPDYRQHSRPLKKVLQELGIAPWERKRLPFLYYDDQLVAVLGHFVCRNFLANEKTKNILIVNWQKN